MARLKPGTRRLLGVARQRKRIIGGPSGGYTPKIRKAIARKIKAVRKKHGRRAGKLTAERADWYN